MFTQTKTLPAPALAGLNVQAEHQLLLPRRSKGQIDLASTLPVPGRDLFAIPEGSVEVLMSTTSSRRAATRLAMAAERPHPAKDKAAQGRPAKGKTAKLQGRPTVQIAPAAADHAAHPVDIVPKGTAAKSTAVNGVASKSLAPRPTRVASLKKRA